MMVSLQGTREHLDVKLGVGQWATLRPHRAAQAVAAMCERSFVIPGDVKHPAVPAPAHRFVAKTEARLRGHSVDEAIRGLLSWVPVEAQAVSKDGLSLRVGKIGQRQSRSHTSGGNGPIFCNSMR